jgi:superoxide dismutase, Fe-Mn family
MSFSLMKLPYASTELSPFLSKDTLDYHYGKHHQTYIDTVNQLIKDTAFEKKTLEDIIRTSSGVLFNNAAQVWNHNFYWNGLIPASKSVLSPKVKALLENTFESVDQFKACFKKKALENFGSGWTWLVKDIKNHLMIVNTSNAHTPLTDDQVPLLTCDVWEHAYYIDYRNARSQYLDHFWSIVNWDFILRHVETQPIN